MTTDTLGPISESMQMYLVTIARLRADGEPVPLSKLAEALSVSPVSVNEMCRKLQDQGFLLYRPYKGVCLTSEGEQRACYILRRHRLWEVFLVQKLGMSYANAHEAACQLEHSTPDPVSDRLDVFLERPAVNPEGQAIPRCAGPVPTHVVVSLDDLAVGRHGHLVRREVGDVARVFLDEQGLRPGTEVTVLASTQESMLIRAGATPLALTRTLACGLWVEAEPEGRGSSAD